MLHTKFKLLKLHKRLVSLLAIRMHISFNLIKHKKEWVKPILFLLIICFLQSLDIIYRKNLVPNKKIKNIRKRKEGGFLLKGVFVYVYNIEISVFRKRLFSILFTVITRGKTHTLFKLA